MVPPAPSGAVEVRSVQPGSMPPPATYPVRLPAAGVGHGPTPPTGPSTHMSREHGTAIPTLAAGSRSPSVDVITPRPVGAPWWVVGAIATATLVLGFLAGYLAK